MRISYTTHEFGVISKFQFSFSSLEERNLHHRLGTNNLWTFVRHVERVAGLDDSINDYDVKRVGDSITVKMGITEDETEVLDRILRVLEKELPPLFIPSLKLILIHWLEDSRNALLAGALAPRRVLESNSILTDQKKPTQ